MTSQTVPLDFVTHSPDETFLLGQALGKSLRPGVFIGLRGPLGAGKTHFVRGVAEGAGVPAREVASPTFSIVSTYEGRLTLHHADLYRIENADELFATGFFDLLDGKSVALVEWADKFSGACPREGLWVSLAPVEIDSRQVQATATGLLPTQVLAEWAEGAGAWRR